MFVYCKLDHEIYEVYDIIHLPNEDVGRLCTYFLVYYQDQWQLMSAEHFIPTFDDTLVS